MRPRRLLVLALVVAVAAVPVVSHVALAAPPAFDDGAAVEGSGAVTVLSGVNTTDYLGFETSEVEREDHARNSLDVVGAIEQDAAAVESEYRALSFEYAYDTTAAGNLSDRIAVELDAVAERVDALAARHDLAIRRYNDRDWDTGRFLRELAAVDAQARSLDARLQRLDDRLGPAAPDEADDRVDELRAELIPLYGPVPQRIGDAVAGDRAPFVAYAITSSDGVVTALAEDGTFYRDAYLGSATTDNGTNQFVGDGDSTGVVTALSRAQALYPWAAAHGSPSVDSVTPPVYPVQFEHDHGVLDAYLDGRTEDVFREYQAKQLALVPVESRTSSGDGLEVALNVTHGTGPLSVTVRDAGSGNPVDANVTIDDSFVGTTGDDGRLWTVASHGSIRLLVEAPDGRTLQRNYVIS